MNHDSKKPVSLEDLLHLKRSERPPEQFWAQFESELRAKQLAAIVQHRPWWNSWGQISRTLTRQSLPIGATAVLALGLLTFHEYRSHALRAEAVMPTIIATQSETPALVATPPPAPVAAEESDSTTASAAVVATAPVAQAKPSAAALTVAADSSNDPFSALTGSPRRPIPAAFIQSDAWSHFGDQQLAANPLASTVVLAPRSFPGASAMAEPLAQMVNPLDERRAALLSGSLPRVDNDSPAESADSLVFPVIVDDRSAASRLSAERLYRNLARRGL